MIDTHLHILPGSMMGQRQYTNLLRWRERSSRRASTPPSRRPIITTSFRNAQRQRFESALLTCSKCLIVTTYPLRLFAGHEALIKPGLVEDIQAGRLATLNGSRYLLLELWNNAWLPETERVIFELRAFGIVPVIAHPERYRALQKDPHRLAALLQQGVVAQVTAGSLIGMQGNTARRTAEDLLKKGLIHCIASDAHCLSRRPPGVSLGIQRAVQLIGQARVYQMIETWPAAILNNEF